MKLIERQCTSCHDSFGQYEWENETKTVCPRCLEKSGCGLEEELFESVRSMRRRGILLVTAMVGLPIIMSLLLIGFNWMVG